MRELLFLVLLWPVLSGSVGQLALQPQVLGVTQGFELASGLAKVKAWEQVAEAKTAKPGAKVQLEFTSAELQAVTQDAVRKLKSPSLDPESITLGLEAGVVVVRGKVIKPAKFWITVRLIPMVTAGQLEPRVASAKVGWLPVSGGLVERMASEVFGERWRSELNPPGFVWDSLAVKTSVKLSGHRIRQR